MNYHCGFKKIEKEEYIVRDGVLSDRYPRFEVDEHKTHITLKRCNETDEGTYAFDENEFVIHQFNLKVLQNHLIDILLTCSMGGEISFECPCCAKEQLGSCRFKKLEDEEYIMRDDALSNRYPRFEVDEHKTHITLKRCNETDEGKYTFYVLGVAIKQFNLTVLQSHVSEPNQEASWKITAFLTTVGAILAVFFIILIVFRLDAWNKKRNSITDNPKTENETEPKTETEIDLH